MRLAHDAVITPTAFGIGAIFVGMLALALREWFVLAAVPTAPLSGDILQYVTYAWNLVEHSTFSLAPIGSESVVADAFRTPGYPGFLALSMLLGGTEGGWYPWAIHGQAVLGALTCVLVSLLARPWIGTGGALATGTLLAFWPHHLAASGALLSEVVFGFLLMLALWLCALACRRREGRLAIAAGAVFAVAYLVNPVVAPFPLMMGTALMLRGKTGRWAIWLLVIPLVSIAGWGLRNATVVENDGSAGRASINLVEGSWPEFHAAYAASRGDDAQAKGIMRAIHDEASLMHERPSAGLQAIASRMGQTPGRYLRWYLIEKPYLLWDWNIRIGMGDVQMLQLHNSPLDTHFLLRGTKQALRAANPLLFSLAAGLALLILARARRSASQPPEAVLVAAFFVFVTLVHVVFQAEPRYSIPYRGVQILLAVAALLMLARGLADRLRKATSPA